MPLPHIRHCLLCEDVRFETRNLVSFMGVYGLTPHVGIEVVNLKLHVAFCAVFVGDPVDGKFALKLQLFSPDGKQIEATTFPERNEQTFTANAGATNFAFRVNAMFPRADTYTLAVSADGAEFFRDTFLITQAKAAASAK